MTGSLRRRSVGRGVAASPVPWLAASVAAFGVVVGMSTYGGTAVQRDLDNLMRTEVVSSSALDELSTGVLDLHDALHGALVGTAPADAATIQGQLDALDAAFARYHLMPASDDERLQAQATEAAYLAWRKEVVVPGITSLREGGPLVAPAAGGEFQRGIVENTMTSRHLAQLQKTNTDHGNANLTDAFRTFDQRSAIILLSGVIGLAGGLAAGFTAVTRTDREGKRTLALDGLHPVIMPRRGGRPVHAFVAARSSTTATTPVNTFAYDDRGSAGFPAMIATGGGEPSLLSSAAFSLMPQHPREPAPHPDRAAKAPPAPSFAPAPPKPGEAAGGG